MLKKDILEKIAALIKADPAKLLEAATAAEDCG